MKIETIGPYGITTPIIMDSPDMQTDHQNTNNQAEMQCPQGK